jgi:hypothetical protein
MKNETALINSTQKRYLTAKGNKFVWQCIEIVAQQNNLHRYSQELKPLREKLRTVLYFLIIDEGKNIDQIKDMIKHRKINFENIKISD